MISRKIMDSGYMGQTGDGIAELAMNRMIDNIRPARKGRDTTKDCVIYEEVLRISELLRNADFDKKIIFASSNTQEYYDDDSLHQGIKKELDERKVIFVNSLNWAESEARRYDLQTMESTDNGA